MKYLKVFLIVLFFVCFACKPKSSSPNSIDLSQNHSVSIFDIISDVDAIQLETLDICLISYVSSFIHYDSKFFIADTGNQKVFCFTEEGDFLFQVSRQGYGKGEYNWLSHISIDKDNNRLAILDGPSQRILFFDLDGIYLETITISTDVSLGLNRVFVLPDSLLLFPGAYEEDFILYCIRTNSIVDRFAELGQFVPGIFSKTDHIFSFNYEWFVYPPLDNSIYRVSRDGFEPHFSWCFGESNNTTDQIERLKANFSKWRSSGLEPIYPFIVGKGRYLNNMILTSFEVDRYRGVCLEFEGDFKNIVVDKETGQNYIFKYFKEGLVFSPRNLGQNSFARASVESNFDQLKSSIESGRWYLSGGHEMKPFDVSYFFNRNHTFYTRDILTERGKQVYDNHDPMTDNPYLVIFKFKE